MSETTPPNPGSPDAAAIGCTCLRADNGHGLGYRRASGERPAEFVMTAGCPVHYPGEAKPPAPEPTIEVLADARDERIRTLLARVAELEAACQRGADTIDAVARASGYGGRLEREYLAHVAQFIRSEIRSPLVALTPPDADAADRRASAGDAGGAK